ncbi:FAD/NAD(P)-binding domain-containing protein [Auricularia subglabra TFB-10046 SS5]|nr:FAD/NAD(P)-binding domain-containing protein [Auricularia subglabra TFB-10046 SS5]
MSRPPVKVAVVGSGLAGLTAAYRLCTEGTDVEVHLFEKARLHKGAQVGMDSSSVTLECGTKRRVDVPMRSFQGGYYPNLIALYKQLGVAFRPSDFTYSFLELGPTGAFVTRLLYNGSSGLGGVSMPHRAAPLKAQGLEKRAREALLTCIAWGMFVLSSLALLLCQVRLCVLSAPWFRPPPQSTQTFRDWAARSTPAGYLSRTLGLDRSWQSFIDTILVPLFSAVCTAGTEDILNHPAVEFLEYIWLTLFTNHYVATLGVKDVVARLSQPIHHIHLSANIVSIDRAADGKVTICASTASSASEETFGPFSHIIVCTQANQAIPLLDSYQSSLPADDPQRSAVSALMRPLSHFHYARNIVINHTDTSLLPPHAEDRRDLNLAYSAHCIACKEQSSKSDLCVPSSFTMATHVVQAPKTFAGGMAPTLLQTTNPVIAPHPETILSVARLQRAVVTPESKAALPALATAHYSPRSWHNLWQSTERWTLGPAQGAGYAKGVAPGLWVCGSYVHGGIPLLEGCVVSSTNVVREILRREQEPAP